MAANPASDFDLGPLTWVKTEIDHSLNQARENLDKLAAKTDDRAPVKYILTHLHQATGALAMVGLGAATRFNEELEKLVAFIETTDATHLPGDVAAAKKGISALSTYLDGLIGGQADHPLRLLAPYLERLHVAQLVLEYATERAGDLLRFDGKELGLGVVNPRTDTVESSGEVRHAVERALRFYAPEQIFLNPDCGFGTFSSRPMNSPAVALAKLQAMAGAARDLRG